MIETPKEKTPEKVERRPGMGLAVMRGMMLLSRLYVRYGSSGYLPLSEFHGKDRADIRTALKYIQRLSAWYFWKRLGKKG